MIFTENQLLINSFIHSFIHKPFLQSIYTIANHVKFLLAKHFNQLFNAVCYNDAYTVLLPPAFKHEYCIFTIVLYIYSIVYFQYCRYILDLLTTTFSIKSTLSNFCSSILLRLYIKSGQLIMIYTMKLTCRNA